MAMHQPETKRNTDKKEKVDVGWSHSGKGKKQKQNSNNKMGTAGKIKCVMLFNI